jgi:hypothetical protein
MKILFLLTMLFIFLLGCEGSFPRDNAFVVEEKGNSTFKVRVSAFRERRRFGGALGGAQYVFEAKNKNQPDWKEFMAYQHDDPIPIDKNSIVLVDEKVGFVFMMKKFAVTTTEGMTWAVWDISQIEPLKDDSSCRIEKANVLENGRGTIDIKCNKSVHVLSTRDFGVSWNK